MANVPHYMTKGTECIDIIEALLTPEQMEGYLKGNIVKYCYRAGDKQDKKRDLEKAADYAHRLAYGTWLEAV